MNPYASRAALSFRVRFSIAVIGLVALSCFAQPQRIEAQEAATATLRGTIQDRNGAVVAGAHVVATHQSIGTSRQTTTNTDGLYVLTNPRPV